ncbi:MAG: c-type cytochrome [Bacteroidia bacterium]
MKNVLLLSLLLLFSGCLKNQWEERLENGDVDLDAQTETAPSDQQGTVAPKNTYKPAVVDGKTIDGKALFKVNCASCHYASSKKGTGPGLEGVLSRIPAGDWKYKWVRNSQELIQAGDAYANAIFIQYNKSMMSAFPALSDGEIDEILRYADGGQ